MISKEKLLNGYIENDEGELRKLWVSAAIYYDFDVTWVDGSECYDNLNEALDSKYCFIYDDAVDSADSETYLQSRNKLTIEDFVEHKTSSGGTKQSKFEVKNCTFTSSDIFQQMLTLAKQNSMFIQFDGFTQDENDAIVITKQGSDTEYIIKTQEQFNQLVESFKLLEKFERS